MVLQFGPDPVPPPVGAAVGGEVGAGAAVAAGAGAGAVVGTGDGISLAAGAGDGDSTALGLGEGAADGLADTSTDGTGEGVEVAVWLCLRDPFTATAATTPKRTTTTIKPT